MDFIVVEFIKHGGKMNTTDKIINDVAVQLANKIIECANYK